VAGHAVVASFRDLEPIPFGFGERLDGLLLTGGALRIRNRRERRGDDERGGKSDDGLGEHGPVSTVGSHPVGVAASSSKAHAREIMRTSHRPLPHGTQKMPGNSVAEGEVARLIPRTADHTKVLGPKIIAPERPKSSARHWVREALDGARNV
jgi:hypothetical protein